MIEFATVARPYAKAVFELAKANGQTKAWSDGLKQLANLVRQPQVAEYINRVDVPAQTKAEQLIGLLDKAAAAKQLEFRNFLYIAAAEKRLLMLPEISQQYEERVLAEDHAKQAVIYTAYAVVSEGQQAKIISDLERHFDVGLQAVFVTDPDLIGGIRVVVGDQVLDLSVQGKLKALYATMTN